MRGSDIVFGDDQESRVVHFGPHEAGQRGNRRRVLCDNGVRQLALAEHLILEAARFFLVQQQSSFVHERGQQRVGDRFDRDHAVLRRATRRVIEDLRTSYLGSGVVNVRGFIDDHRDITGADADRRCAARIRSANVGRRSRCHHQIGLPHQLERVLPRHGRRQHLHQVTRRADAIELGVNVIEQQRQRTGTFRRRREDDRVAALQRVDDIVRRRRRGVRRRRDRRHNADRPGDLDQSALVIFGDDANRLCAA